MLLLETFKVRIFLKIENRWLAYVQMRYQLESTKTIHRVRRWDHLLFGQWLVTLRGQSSAEHGDRSIIFHGRGTFRLANLVETATGYVIMVQYAANLKIRSCHFSFRNCSTLISLSKLVVPSFTSYSNRKSVANVQCPCSFLRNFPFTLCRRFCLSMYRETYTLQHLVFQERNYK